MVFTSLHFLAFFPVVVAAYFLLPNRWRWVHLLIASYYFYMAWKPGYALLLFLSSLSFYCAALVVDRLPDGRVRAAVFWLGIAANLGLLFTFKYYNFFEAQSRELFGWLQVSFRLPELDLLLPMGISFFVFQGISYLIDVYRRDMPAERHLGILLLYKAFFPQLVAGPIERGTHFMPQLRTLLSNADEHRVRFEYSRVVSGLRLMLLGFFKKIVLADNFALIVTPVYAAPSEYSGVSAVVATVAFAFQIFFDFSAYTDIARGSARVLGFELMENFNLPYLATSISDFWQRWHISLSSWFRDYLYIPLGGNRVPTWRWLANLWIVFILCGLWHGANWTFLLWGALHGAYYMLTYLLTPVVQACATRTGLLRFPLLCRAAMTCLTFSMVCWAWVVFRAENVSLAFEIWTSMLSAPVELTGGLQAWLIEGLAVPPHLLLGLDWLAHPAGRLSLMPVLVFAFAGMLLLQSTRPMAGLLAVCRDVLVVRWTVYFSALVAILLLGRFGATQFIYFQF